MKSAQIKILQNRIADLVTESLKSPSKQKSFITINKLTKAEADKIKAKTGFDLTGYYRVLDNFSIIHTIKFHGDEVTESKRGQIAVTVKDFEKIPLIVESENIIYQGKNKAGADVIIYEAIIGNKIFYAEEIRTRQKQLVLNSMWKRKK